MPGADITIVAREALREAIAKWYNRSIEDSQWSTMIPSDPPPDGLRSEDDANWYITLSDAIHRMQRAGYTMKPISQAEAGAVRTRPLVASITKLGIAVQSGPSTTHFSQPVRWALTLAAGALVGGAIGIAMERLLDERRR